MKSSFISKKIREDLKSLMDITNLKDRDKFFKSDIKSYGISIATIRRIIKEVLSKPVKNSEIVAASQELVKSEIFEEKIAGIILLGYELKRNRKEFFDFSVIEEMFDDGYIDNWALCDTLATDVITLLIEIRPVYISKIMDWINSENPWKRRATIVSIIKAKKLNNKKEFINEILQVLKSENDYFVKKALNWLRRENDR